MSENMIIDNIADYDNKIESEIASIVENGKFIDKNGIHGIHNLFSSDR
jgi:hypothetical protein